MGIYKTKSEALFERFCSSNGLRFDVIEETDSSTPDYALEIGKTKYIVEVKQIDEDENYKKYDTANGGGGGGLRTPGSHVRAKIKNARNQVRKASENGIPTILLIHNNLDEFQIFGTEPNDFLTGMYGEMTVTIILETDQVSHPFHGKNRTLREDTNTSFSAIGHLYIGKNGPGIHLYENMYAKVPIDFQNLPSCINWNRIAVAAN